MKINWRVRLKNLHFWLAFIPTACLLVQQFLALGGIDWQYDTLSAQLIAIVGSIFALLALLGVVEDPTTPGVGDSARAMQYRTPGGPVAEPLVTPHARPGRGKPSGLQS
ncbi:MAG: phage holin [Gemmiger sp.]|nr:phage holin [Gemmiger sp.]